MRSLLRRLLIALAASVPAASIPAASVMRAPPLSTGGDEAPASTPHAPKPTPWTARTLELFGSLPVQDGGRIKPLSTYAGFALLRLNGKRTVTSLAGDSKDPVGWLLDVCFDADNAVREPVFLVADIDAITAIGVPTEGKHKRDRWTYAELEPGMPKLFSLAHDYDAIPPKDRSTLQQQVVDLAGNVMSFLRLARFFDFARGGDARSSDALALIPPGPTVPADSAWLTPADVLGNIGPNAALSTSNAAVITELEDLARKQADASAFESRLESLHARLVAMAEARGEYAGVPLERTYYKLDLIGWSLYMSIAAFLIAAFSWLRPRNRKLGRALFLTVLGAALCLVAAIVLRCIIRARPPVSTLYETVLFVTAVGMLVALFLEWVHRSKRDFGAARVAVSAAAILGMVGLFIANGYETLDKQDTMPSLVAVLDTNFWLATHVTCITIGYSAGMLAALLASVYLIGKLLGWKRDDPAFRRELARMVYGVLCFALIFATVGTILGGIWANESWGRFWGWDPKENGALLIVITTLVILHARRGGFIRDHGTCMAAAFLGTVVAFSWWGVNLLGVGLHSYGFTSGIHTALWSYYGLQWGIVGLGGVAQWRERRGSAKELPHRGAAPESRPAPLEKPREKSSSRAKRPRTAA